MNRFMLVTAAAVLTLCGLTRAEDAKVKTVEFGKDAKTTISVPDAWKATTPEGGMRLLELAVPKQGDDKEDAEVSVFKMNGGGVSGNLPRWKGQFGGEDSLKTQRTLKTSSGIEATIAELEGPYKGMSKDGPMTAAKDNFKMLGAIVPTGTGEIYIKLIGPKATVEANKTAFDKMIESLK